MSKGKHFRSEISSLRELVDECNQICNMCSYMYIHTVYSVLEVLTLTVVKYVCVCGGGVKIINRYFDG